MPVLRLLLDQNVPDSVAAVFIEYGHEVHLLREVLLPDSPDPIVAAVSEENGWILVSCDKDFRSIAPRVPKGMRTRFRGLSRISLDCNEPQAAQRVRAAISLVEIEYQIAMESEDRRLFITIQNSGIKTHR